MERGHSVFFAFSSSSSLGVLSIQNWLFNGCRALPVYFERAVSTIASDDSTDI
jgi:hypothetical protein